MSELIEAVSGATEEGAKDEGPPFREGGGECMTMDGSWDPVGSRDPVGLSIGGGSVKDDPAPAPAEAVMSTLRPHFPWHLRLPSCKVSLDHPIPQID